MTTYARVIWLLAACELYAARPDRAVLSVMRSSASDVYYVQVLERVPVAAELNLIVTLGTPKDRPAEKAIQGGGAIKQCWESYCSAAIDRTRFFVDRTADGRLQVVESVIGK